MAGVPRQVREQWPAFLALFGVMILYVQLADVRSVVKSAGLRQGELEARLSGAKAATEDQHRHRRSLRVRDDITLASETNGGDPSHPLFVDSKQVDNRPLIRPPPIGEKRDVVPLPTDSKPLQQKKQQVSPTKKQKPEKAPQADVGGNSAKAEYEWPEVLEEWKLVPESEANNAPLKGEGRLTEDITSIERKGDGVLYNAVHREPSAQRASKPIVEAMLGAKRMRAASKEAGNDSKLRYALVTERAPFEFMLDEVRCRTLWPECVGFKDAVKVFDEVMFYEDFHLPAIIERRERCVWSGCRIPFSFGPA
jgi:hypothetical protein